MTRPRFAVGVLAAGILFAAGAAQAVGTMVIPGCTVPLSFTPQVCGGAQADGFAGAVAFTASPLPQQFFTGPSGVMGVAGGGAFGQTASAGGIFGTFGDIHLSATADNGSLGAPGPVTGQTEASSEIRFLDTGIVSAPGGGLVGVRLTVSLNGLFSGDGEADSHFFLADGFSTLVNSSPLIWGPNPSSVFTQDFLIPSGHQLIFMMQLIASARSGNDAFAEPHSSADVTHTGRLFLDVLTPGATFASASGHNYATDAATTGGVPEPATWAMLTVGFGLLGATARRRRIRLAGTYV